MAGPEDEDPRVRAEAYRALAREARIEELAAELADEDDPLARGVGQDAMARVQLEPQELRRLLAESEEEIARAWAAHALGRYGDGASVEALLAAVEDPSELVRGEVYDALARSNDPRANKALRRAAVKDPSATLRERAESAALASVRAEAGVDVPGELARLVGGAPEEQQQAARALGASGDWRAVQPLLEVAQTSNDLELRKAALLALGQLDDHRVVPELCTLATESAGQLRYHALAALAHIGDESATPTLRALLADPDPGSRQLALRALAWSDAPGVAEILVAALDDPVEEVRSEAIVGLGRISDPARIQGLIQALDDPSPFVRAEAVRLLGESGAPAATDPLLLMLQDKDPLVRLTTADALVAQGASQAIPALREQAEKSRVPEEKAHYERAIERLGG